MSDNIPVEIQTEIMNKLPIKSLIQFRKVCKSWKSMIDSSHFISRYIGHHQHLLVSYIHSNRNYISILDDDDSFPTHRVSLTIPPLLHKLNDPTIIGSSHGLFCLYDYNLDTINMAVIWNPSIRKSVAVMVPNVADHTIYRTDLGFGVCNQTNDPKIVKITFIRRRSYLGSISCIPSQVEVFTLSTGTWRSPYSSSILPRKSIQLCYSHVVIDGVLYWLASDGTRDYELVISFDFTSEEFREVYFPESLACGRKHYLNISKLRNSLVVLASDEELTVYNVWMMEDGVSGSFTKLFTICPPDVDVAAFLVLEFRKSGEPVLEVYPIGEWFMDSTLAVYEPHSKRINDLGINGKGSFEVFAYMETLLLLDQPRDIIYGNTTPALEFEA